MAISKRAKVRIKAMSSADKKKLLSSAKEMYNSELLGPKRFGEIQRFMMRS